MQRRQIFSPYTPSIGANPPQTYTYFLSVGLLFPRSKTPLRWARTLGKPSTGSK
jgi:hypothetical protein